MYSEVWNNCHKSVCSISFLDTNGQKIGSGTGFKIENFLVTNNHVFVAPGTHSVELRFINSDGHTTSANKTTSYADFQARLETGMPENSWDFAILNLNDAEFSNIPSLTLADSKSISIGDEIAVLGFQFDQTNLSIKKGILSSRYTRAGVKYMQVDASINHGNSGGPLINITNNVVVGIVTRKHTGLTTAFDKLIQSFDGNIAALQRGQGMLGMGDVDPIQALIVSQNQLKIAAKEILHSSNVGIGFAYELDQINLFFDGED